MDPIDFHMEEKFDFGSQWGQSTVCLPILENIFCVQQKKEMLVWNNLFKSMYLFKQFHISSKSVKS